MGNQTGALLSYDEYRARKYFPELDGLRAVSVLLVISVHMHDRVWGWLNGWLGVTVFFVLSGYLITTLALREEDREGSLSLGAFYVRRAFRIFPLYYLTLSFYALLILVLNVGPEKRVLFVAALPYHLFYMQEVPMFFGLPDATGKIMHENIPFYQSWSLGIEEKFYLVWPLLAFVIWRRTKGVRLVGTTVLMLLFALVPAFFTLLPPSVDHEIADCLHPYTHVLIGCLLALLLHNRIIFERLRSLGRRIVVWLLLTVFLALHLTWPQVGGRWELFPGCWHFLYSLSAAMLVVGLLLGDGPVQRFFRAQPLMFVGKLSYGIYLIHILALNVTQRLAPPGIPPRTTFNGVSIATYFLACLFSVAVAYVLHRSIEKPCIEFGRRCSQRLLARRNHEPTTVEHEQDHVQATRDSRLRKPAKGISTPQ